MKHASTSTQAERVRVSRSSTTLAEESRRSRDMIRLRGGALLVVGVVLLFVTLSFTGAVAHAMRHDGQGHHAPVGIRLAAPIEDLNGEPPDATPQYEPVAKSPSATQPVIVQAPTPYATKPAPQSSGTGYTEINHRPTLLRWWPCGL